MAGAARVIAGWLTPVMWLMPAAMVLADGSEGLWVGLVVMLTPLVALAVGAARALSPAPAAPSFDAAVLVLVVALLIWANLSLAGDVSAALGIPRWHGVVVAAGPALVVALWRRAPWAAPALLGVALTGMLLPLLLLAQASGLSPIRAWDTLASRPAFRFLPGSVWVTQGRQLTGGTQPPSIAVDEEQRISVAGGGTVRVHTRDGTREGRQEWKLGAGGTVALRAGDRLETEPGAWLRFEAERRVPGAPGSGATWAAGRPAGMLGRLGLAMCLVGGAVALFAEPRFVTPRRRAVVATGAVLLIALLWAQGWSVYGALQAPEVYIGGITIARVAELPILAFGQGYLGPRLQGILLLGLLAGFAAASAALVERPGVADRSARVEMGRDLGLWVTVFAGAAAAGLWPVSPWAIATGALGLAAAAIAPGAMLPAASPRAALAMGVAGAAVFGLLSVLRWTGGVTAGVLAPVLAPLLAQPILAAVPASLAVRWLIGRLAPG